MSFHPEDVREAVWRHPRLPGGEAPRRTFDLSVDMENLVENPIENPIEHLVLKSYIENLVEDLA